MKTLVLLAGQSTRFWPLKDKSLFPVCGKTLVEWQIERLRAAGCDDIAIVANNENATLVNAVLPDMDVYVQEDPDMGTCGALLSAMKHIPKGPIMVVAGTDIVETSAYKEVLRLAAQPGVDGVILGKHMETYFPGGYMTVEGDRVIDIVEKPGEGNEPSNFVNIVVHVHNDFDALKRALENVPDPSGDRYSQTEQILFKSHHYKVADYRGRWNAVKYPWHLLEMMELFLKEKATGPFIHPTAVIHPSAVIEGNVYIDEGVEVLPHAVIVGPAYIGKKSEIRYSSIIRGGSMGERCVIGAHSEIKACVLHSDVWTHGTYLGDTVVGRNVSFGTGTVTANLRLDEGHVHSVIKGQKTSTGRVKFGTAVGSDVRIGMKVGINPGVKIGNDVMISSGVLVTEDIPDHSYVTMKGGHMQVRENKTPVPSVDARDQYRNEMKRK